MPLISCLPYRAIALAISKLFDPWLPSVSSLMHGGVAPNIVDEAGNVVTNSNVVLGEPLSGNYGYFNGTSYISFADSADWNITGNATIEAWVYWNGTMPPAGAIALWGQNPGAVSVMRLSIRDTSGTLNGYIDSDSNIVTCSAKMPSKAWTHLAFVKSGTTYTIYINGVAVGSKVYANALPNAAGAFFVGNEEAGATNSGLTGFMDLMRFTKVARYTDNFTPTKYSLNSGDPDWDNVVLGINFEDGIVDVKGHAATVSGVVKMMPGKTDNPVCYFPGSPSYLLLTGANTGFTSTENFTVEVWVNMPTLPTGSNYFGLFDGTSTSGGLNGVVGANSFIVGRSFIGADHTFTVSWTANTWYHIAIVRNNGTLYVFRDGQLIGAGANTLTYYTGTVVGVGGNLSASAFTGFMSDFRLTRGISRLQSLQFSVPTAEFPADSTDKYWSSVKALLRFNNNLTEETGLTASQGYGVLTYSASAKMGSHCAVFNGNNVTLPIAPPSGDFTIEGWVKLNRTGYHYFCGHGGGSAGGLAVLFNDGAPLEVYTSAGYKTMGSGTLNVGQWYHFAVCLQNGTFYGFIDGVLIGTANGSLAGGGSTFALGYWKTGTSDSTTGFNGMLDDFRITYGVARYTLNFPVPTQRHPDYRDWDYYWDNVVLCMNMNDFTDARGMVAEVVGSPAITSGGRFGGSCFAQAAGGNALLMGASSAWDYSATDVTIEFWAKMDVGYGFAALLGQSLSGNDGNWFAYVYADGRIGIGRSGVNEITSAAGTFKGGSWHHVAITKSGSTVRIFYDGVQVASNTTVVFNSSTNRLMIGSLAAGQGQGAALDDLRITKGVARYVANFSVPNVESYVPTQTGDALWDKTAFLINGDALVDQRGHSLTTSGVTVSGTDPKIGSGSMYFSGTSYVAVAGSDPDLGLGTGDFTIEMWIKPTDLNTARFLYDGRPGSTNGVYPSLSIGAYKKIDWWTNGGSVICTSTTVLQTGNWYHVALCRYNGVAYMYINGVKEAQGNDGNNYPAVANRPVLGLDSYTMSLTPFQGYMDEVRITKGVARYKANFVPSSIALKGYVDGPEADPYWKYTQMLLPFNGTNNSTSIVDAAAGRSSTNSGAVITTENSRTGGSSLKMTSSNYVSVSNAVFGLTDDYTIEFWINFSSINTGQNALVSKWSSWVSNVDFEFDISSSKIRYIAGNGAAITLSSTTTPTTGVWYHVAVVRSKGVTTLYINGVAEATSSTAYTINDNTTSLVFGAYGGAAGHGCYLNSFRVTRAARYKGNFVTPQYKLPAVIVS